jgi:BirA family biotin operon repressor/biotin-[acetyl-CoA-carboxylase] ligase
MIGKTITELDFVDSTNNYIAKALDTGNYEWGTAILAHFQTHGRGQREARWQSAERQNLTFSFALPLSGFDSRAYFSVCRIISLGIVRTLKDLTLENVRIKWPNDILVDRKKIAGILIENKLGKNPAAICGIGLNVNQTLFSELPSATSLHLQKDKKFDIKAVFNSLLKNLNEEWINLSTGDFRDLKSRYESQLFGLQETIDFEESGSLQSGRIIGTTEDGRLKIKTANQEKAFLPKGIKLLY